MKPDAVLVIYSEGQAVQTDRGFEVSGRQELGRVRVVAQSLSARERANVRGTEQDHSHRLFLQDKRFLCHPGQYAEIYFEHALLYPPVAGRIVSVRRARGEVEFLETNTLQ